MRQGKRTIHFNNVAIRSTGSVVCSREGEGQLGAFFDKVKDNDVGEQKSYEKSESVLHMEAIQTACGKLKIQLNDLEVMVGGDLMNQIVGTSQIARKIDCGFLGVYGACSTFGEALLTSALLVNSFGFRTISASSASHFSTAERQYRFPLELGTQPTPTSHRTVSAAGAVILGNAEEGAIKLTTATIGKVVDMAIKNANNMGSVMAGAAADTLITHLNDTGRNADYYDLILTGDLGQFGTELFLQLCIEEGVDIRNRHNDSGVLIFKGDKKTVMGGSGAGCISSVFCSYVYTLMKRGDLRKVLIMPTGALLSKDSSLQGESIPAICYAIAFER